MVSTNFAVVFQLAKQFLRSPDAPADVIPSQRSGSATGENAAELVAELQMRKARNAELEFARKIAICRHQKILDEVKERHAEEVSVR